MILRLITMVDTKSTEQAMKNWEDGIGRAPTKYAEGVKNATGVIEKAIAAEDLYAQKMQEAIASGRRAKKLAEVSDEQWKQAALEKGAARIGPGMIAAKEKMRTGIGKVLDVIRSVQIAPRTADPMANIDNRVKPIAAALHKLKE